MNKNKPKVSIKVKVLVASLIPLFLVTLVISLYSLDALRTGMQDEALSGLRELCYSVSTAYDAIAEGDYRMDGDNLIKGEYNITENEDLIDNFTKNSDSDITIFYGDTRRATSLKDSKTGERILGTKASDAVIEATLKSGEEFTGTDIEINEANYYAVYVPIKSGDGSIVGMVFAGQPSQEIDAVINSRMRGIFILAIIFIIVAAVVVFFVVSRIGSVITKTSDMLLYVSEGNLTLQVDSKMLARKDELGIMVSSLQKLAEQIKSVVTDLKQLSDVLSESGVDLKDFASSTNNAADEISRAVEDMSQGSVSQAEDVENATVQVAEMGNSIENIVDEIENLYSNSEKMEKSKNEAEKIVNELAASSDHTYYAVKRIEKQVKLTDESVTQIQQAVALITSIE